MLCDLTDEQRAFAASVRRHLDRHAGPSVLRRAWSDGPDHGRELWTELAGSGLLGLLGPERYGGSDAGVLDLLVALEEVGYHAVPEPVVETAAVVVPVLARYGGEDLRQRWLPALCTGRAVATVCLDGASLVVDAARADVTLVQDGATLHLVPADRAETAPVDTQDPTRRLSRVRYRLDATTELTRAPEATRVAVELATAGTAAVLLGVADRLVAMTRDHVLTREQFGRTIGTFQAVKHRLADAAVAVEAGRSLLWNCGYRLDAGDPAAAQAVSMAKAGVGDAAAEANYAALQLHGGIGFTWEHDLHLWLKRGQALERAYGTTLAHRDRLMTELLADHSAIDHTGGDPR